MLSITVDTSFFQVCGASTAVSLTGTGLSSSVKVSVRAGSEEIVCTPVSSNATSVSCTFGQIPAGTHSLYVNEESSGEQ